MRRQEDYEEDLAKKIRAQKRSNKRKPKMKVSGAGVKRLAELLKRRKG